MVGGFAHLKSLVKRLRAERGDGNSLLLDGGDTWQGSGTAYWTRGMDMVGACNLLHRRLCGSPGSLGCVACPTPCAVAGLSA